MSPSGAQSRSTRFVLVPMGSAISLVKIRNCGYHAECRRSRGPPGDLRREAGPAGV